MSRSVASRPDGPGTSFQRRLAGWWPLAALTVLAAALRLSTLDLQSFWYDEAFTPVHVLHPSLWATLHAVAHSENSPPLWYVLAWADARVLGDGEVALRLPSALAGIAAVPVAWAIGRELAGRGAAIACAALLAVNPLFVWYSQEARAYGLYALTSALAVLCFLRARSRPDARHMRAFALAAALALLSHYFAVFLLAPMAVVLLAEERTRRAALPALLVVAALGLALLPLLAAQGGHGTQWIGRWPLGERLAAIPQYFLLGTSGAPLGHGIELLLALPALGLAALALWRPPERSGQDGDSARDRVRVCLWLLAGALLLPILLAVLGADYLAPRNLLGAMVPLTALLAIPAGRLPAMPAGLPAARSAAAALAAFAFTGFLAISVDVDLSPRLQRGNWRGLAERLRQGPGAGPDRAITTVELGAAPLEYYMHGLHNLPTSTTATLTGIDETGYAPLRPAAGRPPAAGFTLSTRINVDGLILLRFGASGPRPVRESALRRHVITLAHPEVLVPATVAVVRTTP